MHTQVHRKDGASFWVHLDQWEGQVQPLAGNLISAVYQLHIDPNAGFQTKLALHKENPAGSDPGADTSGSNTSK